MPRGRVGAAVLWLAGLCLGFAGALRADEPQVLVAYYSAKGHTRLLAEAVAEGARGVAGVDVELAEVAEIDSADLIAAEAIILGSPVYNGNVAPEVQTFINGWPFRGAPMRDKIGAAFVTGGGISAGEEAAQLGILRSMLVFGMVVVGGAHWTSAFGASAITEEEPFVAEAEQSEVVASRFLAKGRALGQRVAELTLKFGPSAEGLPPATKSPDDE
ncbi:MAG: flavodoxin family protein [Acidobacteriota bacterium]